MRFSMRKAKAWKNEAPMVLLVSTTPELPLQPLELVPTGNSGNGASNWATFVVAVLRLVFNPVNGNMNLRWVQPVSGATGTGTLRVHQDNTMGGGISYHTPGEVKDTFVRWYATRR